MEKQQGSKNSHEIILSQAQLSSSIYTVECQLCKKMINSQNIALHQIKCGANQIKNKGIKKISQLKIKSTSSFIRKKSSSRIKQQSIIKNINISEQSQLKPKEQSQIKRPKEQLQIKPAQRKRNSIFKGSYLKEKIELPIQKKEQQQQKIPCINCGYMQTFAELDTHPNDCLGSYVLCKRCESRYPAEIIDEHYELCKGSKISAINVQKEKYQHQKLAERQEQKLQQQFFDFNENERPEINYEEFEPQQQQIDLQLLNQEQMQEEFRRQIRQLARSSLHQKREGVSKKKLDEIKQHKYVKDDKREVQQCPICYFKYEQNQSILWLRCIHCFHSQCIKQWLKINPCCPCCKISFQQKK